MADATNFQNDNSKKLTRPFTVHSYFSNHTPSIKNNVNPTLDDPQEPAEAISFRKRFKENVNKLWLKTKDATGINSSWLLMILFIVMLVIIIVLVIVASAKDPNAICLTPTCLETASRSLKSLDNTIDPCVDFYSFACGSYIKEVPLDEKITKSVLTTLSDIVTNKIHSILMKNNDTQRISLKKFYAQCLNSTYSYDKDIDSIKFVLNSLGDWPLLVGDKWNESNFDLKELSLRLKKIGIPYDFVFGFKIEVNPLGTNTYALCREPKYFKNFDLNTIKELIVLLGVDRSIVQSNLLNCSKVFKSINDLNQGSGIKYSTLEILSNDTNINWTLYMNKLFETTNITIAKNEPIIFTPRNFPLFINYLMGLPKRLQANVYFCNIINWMIQYLPSLYKLLEHKLPKTRNCIEQISKSLPLLINSYYVKRFFNYETKVQVETLVSNVRKEFLKILKTVEWLDDETRRNAIEKLNSMKTCVGYPDALLDEKNLDNYYETLNINYTSYLSIMMSINIFNNNKMLKRLRDTVSNCYWIDISNRVAMINAHYYSFSNGMEVPAAFLQDAVFDETRPNYINYAIAGMIIGHEMTHGFDNDGKNYDKDGNFNQWWNNKTLMTFMEKTECLITQYKKYVVSDLNLNVDGVRTLGENIADNGGLKQAFLAYSNWVKQNGPEKKLPGLNYTSNQMFWIAFAQFWCSYESLQYQKAVWADLHAPSRFRVIGTLSNIERFAKDFKCPMGSPMNPKTKCKIW